MRFLSKASRHKKRRCCRDVSAWRLLLSCCRCPACCSFADHFGRVSFLRGIPFRATEQFLLLLFFFRPLAVGALKAVILLERHRISLNSFCSTRKNSTSSRLIESWRNSSRGQRRETYATDKATMDL